ncbi:sigma-70 family RNA polymerase sigma factor [Elizabethkingia anophelis]|uniref:sigma-70 family RNA polymerase sigma factor n=1 Tax=Elizabethkingia anophelis TaxID=1117645 RepID=UPI0013685933|nr:sigma-70 family RNA polymerase sigma factor [Elizabethkingia anophelis]MYY43972.1 sigma-70 family RNA polymerase sigma factor [Elizabethkingia anophelis]
MFFSGKDDYNQALFFQEVFEEYNQRIFLFIAAKVSQRDNALEITQEVFIHLWHYRKELTTEKRDSIIFKTCRQAISRFFKHHPGNPPALFLEELQLHLIDDAEEELEYRLEKESRLEQMQAAIQTLPEKRKYILVANKIEGKTQKQIATEMNLSRTAVENQIQKAMLFLKAKLLG